MSEELYHIVKNIKTLEIISQINEISNDPQLLKCLHF